MALSDAEKLSVFQLLGVPTKVPKTFDPAHDAVTNDYQQDLIDQLNTWLTGASSTEETEIRAIVEEFDPIKYEPVRLQADGLTYDYEEKRSLLRSRIKIMLPFEWIYVDPASELIVG